MDAKELVKYINKALLNLNRQRLVRTISSVIPATNKNKNKSPSKRKRAASN
jgi:hypothetical protein